MTPPRRLGVMRLLEPGSIAGAWLGSARISLMNTFVVACAPVWDL